MQLRLPEVDGSQRALRRRRAFCRYQELRLMPHTRPYRFEKEFERRQAGTVRRERDLMTAAEYRQELAQGVGNPAPEDHR